MTATISVIVFIFITATVGVLFLSGNRRDPGHSRNAELTSAIDGLLPQSQCRMCGFSGCRPYAEAIVTGKAEINRCPPGGEHTIRLLAELLGRTPPALERDIGDAGPDNVAFIDEKICIGCVKCIIACPVDAIIGASKQMHTVMPKVCTGCELCIVPCPVNCISMVPAETKIKKFVWNKPQPLSMENRA